MGARISDRIAAIARVRDAGRRRQGQGAQGRRPAGDRLRCRRAGLPDAGLHRRGGRRRPPATRSYHRYTPVAGLPELRDAVAAKTRRDSGYAVDAAQVLITNGGKQAVYNAFATLLDPGDEVLVARAVLDHLPRGDQARRRRAGRRGHRRDHRLPRDGRAARGRTHRRGPRCCCSCRRPTRPAPSTHPIRSLRSARWAAERGLWVVTDEIYEHLVYGDAQHVSIAPCAPDLGDRIVVVNGVAKTYAMTGWRVGWLIGPADVVKAATNLQSHATSNVANVSQVAALAAVSGDLSAVRGDARRVRSAPADDRRAALRHPGNRLSRAGGGVLRLPVGQGSARHDRCADGWRTRPQHWRR